LAIIWGIQDISDSVQDSSHQDFVLNGAKENYVGIIFRIVQELWGVALVGACLKQSTVQLLDKSGLQQSEQGDDAPSGEVYALCNLCELVVQKIITVFLGASFFEGNPKDQDLKRKLSDVDQWEVEELPLQDDVGLVHGVHLPVLEQSGQRNHRSNDHAQGVNYSKGDDHSVNINVKLFE
jgi:hypothetical protein